MSEDQGVQETPTDQAGEVPEDPIKNLKTEFGRKIENLNKVQTDTSSHLKALTDATQKLAEQLRPKQDPSDEDAEWLTEPAKAKAKLKEEIRAEIEQSQAAVTQAQASQQAKYNELLGQFPELGNPSNELVKKAQSFIGDRQLTPELMEAAVFRAATEMGVKPASLRDSGSDEFTGSSSKRTSKPDTKGDVPDTMMQFAQLLGQPVDDPEYQKRLKKHMERKDWMRYR